jgi:hypothetical protein
MFNRSPVLFQWLATVTAIAPKCGFYRLGVSCVGDAEFERSTYFAAQIVKEHADELISHIGLCP